MTVARYAWASVMKPGYEERYRRRRGAIWPEMVEPVAESGTRNSSNIRRLTPDARVGYDSVRGRIESGWEVSEGGFRSCIAIPPNATATVRVPSSQPNAVTVGGVALDEAEGRELLHTNTVQVDLSVGSGRHGFASREGRG